MVFDELSSWKGGRRDGEGLSQFQMKVVPRKVRPGPLFFG